jgi:hypothetical protein
MPFEIPTMDLGVFNVSALNNFREQALMAKIEILADKDADSVTDEELDQAKGLHEFATVTIPAAIAKRTEKSQQFATLTEAPAAEAEVVEEVEGEVADETEFAAKAKTIRVANISSGTQAPETEIPDEKPQAFGKLVAAAESGLFAGQEITTKDVAEALLSKDRLYTRGGVPQSHLLAKFERSYPDHLNAAKSMADEQFQTLLEGAANEHNLPGGSLLKSVESSYARLTAEADPGRDAMVAAGGWCAPSETDYSICFQGTTDGTIDTPEIAARRGGVRHTTGLEWSTVYGGGNLATAVGTFPTGFFNLSEAQVAAGSPVKNCVQVFCPSFTDDRLGVTGICITSPILQNRAYPESVDTFIRGAMVVHAHQINALQIAAMVAGSTAVTLAATDPWQSDGSTTSNILGAVEMAIVDMKYRLRLSRSATLEVVLPFWILGLIRADLSRRTGYELAALSVTDSQIISWFSQRGARVQFVYDWQDGASTAAGPTNLPGLATAPTMFPTTVQFLVYPAGTWVRAVEDVITLTSIYDSTLLATNMVTQLFTEEGWTMLKMCPLSRVYTVPVCPSGQTTAAAAVDCITA